MQEKNNGQQNNLKKTLQKVVKEEVRIVFKEEGEKFVTKEDMENFKTEMKGDFKDFGDRAFKVFATKQDLKESEERIIKEVKFERNRVLESNDKVVKKMTTIEQEQAADNLGNMRRDDRLDNLEKNVKGVKKKLRMEPAAI